jgi:hypothetical protein
MRFPRQLRLVLTTKSLRFVFLACVIEARKILGAPFIAQSITASRSICAEPGERHDVAWHHRDGKKHAIFACLMLVFPCLIRENSHDSRYGYPQISETCRSYTSQREIENLVRSGEVMGGKLKLRMTLFAEGTPLKHV